MSTLALYVNASGCLVKIVNGIEVPCSAVMSLDIARLIIDRQSIREGGERSSSHVLKHTKLRGLVLEQEDHGSYKTIPLADLLPTKLEESRGTYHIMVDFVPEKKGK